MQDHMHVAAFESVKGSDGILGTSQTQNQKQPQICHYTGPK